jgi:large subunit ribosomal protein L13
MMGANTVKTFSPKPRDIERRWYVVDADGAVLGRLASEVAKILRGKHKPIFAPHMDTGDHVIVVNAKGVRLTGGKEEKKVYYRHSGYPGGINRLAYSRIFSRRPAQVVEKAITGMLPKNRLGRHMARKLAVYEGPEHPHQAQKPVPLPLGEVPKWEGLPKTEPQSDVAPTPRGPRQKEEPKSRRARKGPEGKAGAKASTRKTSTSTSAKTKAGSSAKSSRKQPETSASPKTSRKPRASSSVEAGTAEVSGAEEKSAPKRRSRARKKTEKE